MYGFLLLSTSIVNAETRIKPPITVGVSLQIKGYTSVPFIPQLGFECRLKMKKIGWNAGLNVYDWGGTVAGFNYGAAYFVVDKKHRYYIEANHNIVKLSQSTDSPYHIHPWNFIQDDLLVQADISKVTSNSVTLSTGANWKFSKYLATDIALGASYIHLNQLPSPKGRTAYNRSVYLLPYVKLGIIYLLPQPNLSVIEKK